MSSKRNQNNKKPRLAEAPAPHLQPVEPQVLSASQVQVTIRPVTAIKSPMRLQDRPNFANAAATFQPFKELDEWQNKAMESLITLFPEAKEQQQPRVELINAACEIFVKKEVTESNASDQDRDQFQIYCLQSLEKDLIKAAAGDGAGERPDLFQKRILGTTSKYDLHKDYSLKFREELNKHTADEYHIVLQSLRRLLHEAQESAEISGHDALEVFQILLLELYDKACLETKFVGMYARLICALSQDSFYKAKGAQGARGPNLSAIKEKIIGAFGEGLNLPAEKLTVSEIIKKKLVSGDIYTEIKQGASGLKKYEPKAGEAERDRLSREQNLMVHLRGCISFCGAFYLEGLAMNSVLLSDFVMVRLLIFIMKNQAKAIAKTAGYGVMECDKIGTLDQMDTLAAKIKEIVACCTQQKLQLDVPYIASLEKMLEKVWPKLIGRVKATLSKAGVSAKEKEIYETLAKDLESIKECLLDFNETIIPSYIYFKLRECVFKDTARQTSIEKAVAPPTPKLQNYSQMSYNAFEEELVETSLNSVLKKLLAPKEVTVEAILAEPRLLEFFIHVLRTNKHAQLLISQLQMLLRTMKQSERTQLLSSFALDFYNLLQEEGIQKEAYWAVFKFLARYFQADLKLYDFTSQLDSTEHKSQFFITQIVKATVDNSFEQTLADQYENLLDTKTTQIAKQLIKEHRYYEVTQIPELQKLFCEEKLGYFAEPDAEQFKAELMTPFDEEALLAFKSLFQTSLQTSDFRQKLSEFCKHFHGEKAATKLYALFQEVGFECGFQVISIIKPIQDNFSIERKMRGFLLEYTIKHFVETKQDNLLKAYVAQYKQISLCLLEKAMGYFKDRPGEFVDLLRMCEGSFDVAAMKANIAKKAADQKSWGLLKEVVEYGKKL